MKNLTKISDDLWIDLDNISCITYRTWSLKEGELRGMDVWFKRGKGVCLDAEQTKLMEKMLEGVKEDG